MKKKLQKLLHRKLSTFDDNITTKDFPVYKELIKNIIYYFKEIFAFILPLESGEKSVVAIKKPIAQY